MGIDEKQRKRRGANEPGSKLLMACSCHEHQAPACVAASQLGLHSVDLFSLCTPAPSAKFAAQSIDAAAQMASILCFSTVVALASAVEPCLSWCGEWTCLRRSEAWRNAAGARTQAR